MLCGTILQTRRTEGCLSSAWNFGFIYGVGYTSFFFSKKNLFLLIMMRTWDGSSLLKLWNKKALHVSKGRLNKLPIFHCLSNSLNLDHNSHTVSIWCSSRCPMPVFLWVNLMLYFWYFTFGFLWVDSIFRWVSNGVVGSPAFAAYDQGLLWIFLEYLLQFYANHFSSAYFFFPSFPAGYDVFLGNFRGLVSREHVNKDISSRRLVLSRNSSLITSNSDTYHKKW